jgi:hypothetical protein
MIKNIQIKKEEKEKSIIFHQKYKKGIEILNSLTLKILEEIY